MAIYMEYTSADIQAEIYHQLRIRNIQVHVEVNLPSSGHRSGKMRADIVVYKEDKIAFLIECKYPSFVLTEGRQRKAYLEAAKQHKAPAIYLTKFEDAEALAKYIQHKLSPQQVIVGELLSGDISI